MRDACDGTSAEISSRDINAFVVPIIKGLQFLLKAYPYIVYSQYIGNKSGCIFKRKLLTIKDVTGNLIDGFGFMHSNLMSQKYEIQEHLKILLRIYNMSEVSDTITLSSDDNVKLNMILKHWNEKRIKNEFNRY